MTEGLLHKTLRWPVLIIMAGCPLLLSWGGAGYQWVTRALLFIVFLPALALLREEARSRPAPDLSKLTVAEKRALAVAQRWATTWSLLMALPFAASLALLIPEFGGPIRHELGVGAAVLILAGGLIAAHYRRRSFVLLEKA